MLIICPECKLQASDKALICPHCGYPLKKYAKNSKSKRRMKLPNGFGQIYEIKNRNLRNPFRAMVTVGKTDEGKPICKSLKPKAYFKTYNEAYAALMEYNQNPYDLSQSITMNDLYEKWSKEHFERNKSSSSTVESYTSSWKYCTSIYNIEVRNIRIRHLRNCIENASVQKNGFERKATPGIKKLIKVLFNLMFDYAVEYEITDKNYAREFSIKESKEPVKSHMAFTDNEMSIMWENVNRVPYTDVILIQCYSGWRPQEMYLLELKNTDIEKGFFQGGIKTKAGKNRIVPIHQKIMPLVKKRYEEAERLGSKYLINKTEDGTNFTYHQYKKMFTNVITTLNLDERHLPHDCRKQFVTMAKKYNVDEYAIKYIVGHTITDITEKTYTQRNVDWLKSEMEKIK